MGHFAELDNDNIVLRVVRVENSVILNADNTESELKGKQFLNSLLGSSKWVQTSYSRSFRKNYAGVGYSYDATKDAFIPPKPYTSWTLNETTCLWEAPEAYPNDGNIHNWDESSYQWVLVNTIVDPANE